MSKSLPIDMSAADIEAFGSEIDAIYHETKADLGDRDARYIRRLITIQRGLGLAGRLVILASLALLPVWPLFLAASGVGTLMLATAKILENMEIGHNVMHGQWDWMRDPDIQSATWEWDTVCPADQWKHSHNVLHHTWTNVIGKDRDVGYGMLRVADEQRWHPVYLLQPFSAFLLMAPLFEWFIALHDLEINRVLAGKRRLAQIRPKAVRVAHKMARQGLKDYVLWPLLAGPFLLYVLAANVIANVLRNLWTYLIIFCGHFPAGVHMFTADQIEGETRARWYLRQVLGSCNITGGRLFHVMSGNLSHQIEHHLFPDLSSNRYPEVAPRVRTICARYGVPYNSASLARQFGTMTWKIFRLALPPTKPHRIHVPQNVARTRSSGSGGSARYANSGCAS